jgi:iron complex outermembrane receptor protein
MKIQALWLSASVLALGWCGAASAETTSATAASTEAASAAAPAASAEAAPAAAQGGSGTAPADKSDSKQVDTVKEVVVTAERRNTALQKTPIAATVLTGADLIKNGVFTVDELQFVSPSLTVNNFGQGNNIDIRGIGKGEHNTQTGTGVITYRDGSSSFPGYFQEEPYFDVASVEVLRGPQGTFAGQNATGGAVIVNTNNPVIGGGYDGYLLGHFGNYNDLGLQGAVNLPINDTLAARVAVNLERRDSFYDISGPMPGNPNLAWGSARFSLLWQPTSQLKVLWKTDYDYLDNGGYFGDAMSVTNPTTGVVSANPNTNLFKFANNYETFAVDQFVRTILRADYTADNGITFRSVSTAATGRTAWTGDIDGTAWTQPTTQAPTGANDSISEAVHETLLSQEFNVISPNTGPLTWILGAYIQSNVYNFPHGNFDIGVPPGGFDEDLNGTNWTHTWALFGQATYKLPAGFELQVGLRYSSWFTANKVTYDVPEEKAYWPYGLFIYNQDASESGSNLTGKVTLNWNLNAHNFLYAFVATGAKPGGLNTGVYDYAAFTILKPPAPFRQEYVTDYEIGWKSSLFSNHLQLQLGAYDNIFQHFQVNLPIPTDPVLQTQQNVQGNTKLYGVEASAEAVFGAFQFNTGLGLEHSQLGTFYSADPFGPAPTTACNPGSGPAVGPCVNLAGHPQTYAPDFTFNMGAQYAFTVSDVDKLTPRITYSHISKQWGTLFDNAQYGEELGERDILGASLAWTRGSITTTLYGYNLTNDEYISALASPIRFAGAPRQFGISVMKTF